MLIKLIRFTVDIYVNMKSQSARYKECTTYQYEFANLQFRDLTSGSGEQKSISKLVNSCIDIISSTWVR